MYKRDLHMWKDTYMGEVFTFYICEKNPTHMNRDIYIWKETSICEAYTLYIYEKRLTYMKRDLHMWKETNMCEKRTINVKRDLHVCKKRPIFVKRDLQMWSIHVIYVWKETYTCETFRCMKIVSEKRHTRMKTGTRYCNRGVVCLECEKCDMATYIYIWKETYIC